MEANFWDHVEELRKIFIRSLITIAVGIAVAFFFYQEIFALMTSPLQGKLPRHEIKYERVNNPFEYSVEDPETKIVIPPHSSIVVEKKVTSSPLVVLGPMEGMMTAFKMSFCIGLVATSPIWFYFLFSFVAPALEPYQRRIILPFIVMSVCFMTIGMLFSFYCTIPIANQYLRLFNETLGTNIWTVSNYLDYTIILLLANGIAFEFAVILLFLVHYRIVHPDSMTKKRRHMIVLSFIVSAVLTPPDILTQFMLAVPLIVLYEGIIVYARIREKIEKGKRQKTIACLSTE